MDKFPAIKLNSGLEMPSLGFGTWQLSDGDEGRRAVTEALEAGYRLIDTAKLYGNETSVGQAVADSGLPRQDIFITTKLWNDSHGYDKALEAFDASLKRLAMEYVDLYLIHWPASTKLNETWQALGEINRQGRAKSIGVANYSIMHLQELMASSDIPPAVNQIEFHPFVYSPQKPIVDFCQRHGIATMAYSPLSHAQQINHPAINAVASRLGKTNAQVMLRWAIQHGTVPIPKSAHPGRIRENIDVFDFELTSEDMRSLNSLG